MSQESNKAARTAIQKIAGTYGMVISQILFAEVISVDMGKRTCKVKPISSQSSTEIEDVCLSIDKNDGEIKKPAIGSTVGVAISTDIDAFVFAWSDIDEIILKGGNFYGIPRVEPLTQSINKLEQEVNKIKQVFSSWTPVPNDGGAALKSAASSWASDTITETQQSDIENKKITHGDR